MKKTLTLFAVLAAVLTAGIAFGAVKDFGAFKLDLPKGWKVTDKYVSQDPVETTITLENGKRSTISVTFASRNDNELEGMVEDWAHMEDNSTEPTRTKDGYYTFTFKKEDGARATGFAKTVGDMYLYVEMTGKDTKAMTAIRDSFVPNN